MLYASFADRVEIARDGSTMIDLLASVTTDLLISHVCENCLAIYNSRC